MLQLALSKTGVKIQYQTSINTSKEHKQGEVNTKYHTKIEKLKTLELINPGQDPNFFCFVQFGSFIKFLCSNCSYNTWFSILSYSQMKYKVVDFFYL